MRQLMSGKDNAAKADDSLGTNHLVVCCDLLYQVEAHK